MGLFNFNKKKKFLSKLSFDQQDEIIVTLILMKQMIEADGVIKTEETEYYKNYLINCGISSKEELESIIDRTSNLTSEQYDMIVGDFDEIQKLNVLQELFGIICSDDDVDDKEIELLFKISRDMEVEDDLVIDMLEDREDYFKKKNESDLLDKYVTNGNLSNHLSKLVSYLENITESEKGDIYNYKYWFEQVVKRVESHETWYDRYNVSDSNDLRELTHYHYIEYHHRMIEENDEQKLKFVIPRVNCFLEVFKKIDEINRDQLIENDKELYDRYNFHSKGSLYAAVKFLVKDVHNGQVELEKIYPEFDDKILEFNDEKYDKKDDMISKSTEILSSSVRSYLNQILLENAERFVEEKNTSAYHGLIKLINNSLPSNTYFVDKEKCEYEVKNLSGDEKEFLTRVISSISVYSELQNFNLFISKTLDELNSLNISVYEELELEDIKTPNTEDEWEEFGNRKEGNYTLVKKNQNGTIVHKKFYIDGKLDRFNLSKQKDEIEDFKKFITALIYYSYGWVSKEDIGLQKDSPDELIRVTTEMSFWKLYNSYDNEKNLPHLILNEYAYFLYDLNHLSEGIHLASLAFKINEDSSYADTVGEGYFKQDNYDMALSSFSNAVEIDKKNNSHNEEHISNYIKAALKTENLKFAQNGIELLKNNFPDSEYLKENEENLSYLKSKLESNGEVLREDLWDEHGNSIVFQINEDYRNFSIQLIGTDNNDFHSLEVDNINPSLKSKMLEFQQKHEDFLMKREFESQGITQEDIENETDEFIESFGVLELLYEDIEGRLDKNLDLGTFDDKKPINKKSFEYYTKKLCLKTDGLIIVKENGNHLEWPVFIAKYIDQLDPEYLDENFKKISFEEFIRKSSENWSKHGCSISSLVCYTNK